MISITVSVDVIQVVGKRGKLNCIVSTQESSHSQLVRESGRSAKACNGLCQCCMQKWDSLVIWLTRWLISWRIIGKRCIAAVRVCISSYAHHQRLGHPVVSANLRASLCIGIRVCVAPDNGYSIPEFLPDSCRSHQQKLHPFKDPWRLHYQERWAKPWPRSNNTTSDWV